MLNHKDFDFIDFYMEKEGFKDGIGWRVIFADFLRDYKMRGFK